MDSKKIAERIRADLSQYGKGSRQGHRPSAQIDFGVYAKDLQFVVRTFKKLLKHESGQKVHDIADLLIAQNVYESRQVAYQLIYGHAGARTALTIDRVESLGVRLDNWACVDTFCSNIAGYAWRSCQIRDEDIIRWAERADVWWRRAAVVATVSLNTKSRGGKGDADRTLRLCAKLVDDDEPMVQKAISWALRELVPWDREAVEQFLVEYEDVIGPRVRREVVKKLTVGKKN